MHGGKSRTWIKIVLLYFGRRTIAIGHFVLPLQCNGGGRAGITPGMHPTPEWLNGWSHARIIPGALETASLWQRPLFTPSAVTMQRQAQAVRVRDTSTHAMGISPPTRS